MNVENKEPTEARSQNDPRPELDVYAHRQAQRMDSDPEETSYNLRCFPDELEISKFNLLQDFMCKIGLCWLGYLLFCGSIERYTYWFLRQATW